MARTHRYKLLIFGSLVLLAVGLYLLTNLHANTDRTEMWIWMIIAGLGIGPSFAVFTLIVQNSVPPREVGTASSSLTFFQQIGGTVGLTIASTIFASRLIEEIPPQLVAAGVPQQFIDQFQAQQGSGQGAEPHGNWRPGHANPGPGAGSVQGARRAAATADRGRHPRSVLTGCGIDVLDRHRRSSLAALAVLFLKEIQCARPSRCHPRRRKRRRPRSPTAGEGAPA